MQHFKTLLPILYVLLIAVLAVSTLLDPVLGTSGLSTAVYSSPLFVLLWAVMALLAVAAIVRMRLWRLPATLLIHAAFLVILCGALVTHVFGEQGTMSVRQGVPERMVELGEGEISKLPFTVTLSNFEIDYYPGTSSPQDYRSHLTLSDGDSLIEATVSMNKIYSHRGYRFYQSGYDPDLQGSRLMVAHDPWGIGITYTGYLLLLLSFLTYFFHPQSRFRQLLRKPVAVVALLLAMTAQTAEAKNMPKVAPTDVAEQMGDLYIYYNGRVAPMETFAHDFTTKLCGADHYRGRTANEVLAGWVFFPDTWKTEPMIKVKRGARRAIGTDKSRVSLRDMANHVGDYKLQPLLDQIRQGENVSGKSDLLAADEKVSIINGLFTGASMKIFPIRDKTGKITWYSAVDQLPQDLDIRHWTFIRKSMDLVTEKVVTRRYTEARELLQKIKQYQERECGNQLPSPQELRAEKTYNRIASARIWAMACVTIGLLAFAYTIWLTARGRRMNRWVGIALRVGLVLVWCYLTLCMYLRFVVSHHLPISNGFETMQALAWISFLLTLWAGRRLSLALPCGYLGGGLAVRVACIVQGNPTVTNLMPVLNSPLLSLHVMVIMVAYALLAFVLLNGLSALILSRLSGSGSDAPRRLQRNSLLLLYPAVFLLAIGIFVGAVWANVSWGRYWGWDPKEVWALITMLVYAVPLHRSVRWFDDPIRFHWFGVLAFLTVLMTYFGANFFLAGMHSYA